MIRRRTISLFVACLSLICAAVGSKSPAAEPQRADVILPDTTKCYLSIADLDELVQAWQQTAIGRFASQPAIKPFVDDLMHQFQENMSLVRRLGTDWSELQRLHVQGIDWAIVQPENDPKQVAVALIGRVDPGVEATTVLAEMIAGMKQADGKVTKESLAGQTVYVVRWPKEGQDGQDRVAYFLAEKTTILASDDAAILTEMLGRREDPKHSLHQFKPYAEIMQRCSLSNLDRPDLKWFIEPFGFAETLRASNGGRRKRGRDLLAILPRQGFSAIQGVGGVFSSPLLGLRSTRAGLRVRTRRGWPADIRIWFAIREGGSHVELS